MHRSRLPNSRKRYEFAFKLGLQVGVAIDSSNTTVISIGHTVKSYNVDLGCDRRTDAEQNDIDRNVVDLR